MKIGYLFGQSAYRLLNERMRGIQSDVLEVDEIWTFVKKKQKNLTVKEQSNPHIGSIYLWTALDRDTKLVPWFFLGKRTDTSANEFMEQLSNRVSIKMISTDGLISYPEAIKMHFGNVSHAATKEGNQRVERHNWTIRTFMRRFTRKSCGFSKKFDNLHAATSLFIAYYNFVWRPRTIDQSPSKLASVVDQNWEFEEFFERLCWG